jgi:hypothetical protein
MAQGDDDVEVTMDAEGSGARLMMLLRPTINSERTEERTEDVEDDIESLTAENAQGVDDC